MRRFSVSQQEKHPSGHQGTALLHFRNDISPSVGASQSTNAALKSNSYKPGPRAFFTWISNCLFTLYLFTANDFSSVLFPQTLFALFSMLSKKFSLPSPHLEAQLSIYSRIFRVVLWIWLQLLVLDLANQRLPDSVSEDTINKPWRPITSGRITVENTRRLLLVSIGITFAVSHFLGATYETLFLFTLNWMYNDLGLANSHWLMRNLMNALGITSIGAGATRVACGDLVFLIAPAARWWLLCAGMIMTTIHAQDLYDQQGDAVRRRSTVPLVHGDSMARCSVAAGVLFWSVVMPACFNLHFRDQWVSYVGPILLGSLVTARVLILREVSEDKLTFKFWALWIVCIYSLPLAG
ncbi:hypothetical protein NUW58_g3262 [Xylaria curta]|uniref:Uncharacterized protein n=1 Tax=Xylaria curta TaxID=42375 RepID=A0ACC1PBU4_9PEZI|nr:hypothetical protein NUW58_g3262 [Xylaria curta]